MSAGIAAGSRVLKAAAVAGAALLLGGCGLFHRDPNRACIEPPQIQTARDQGPLRVPPGLHGPDRTNEIKIPALQAARTRAAGKSACLFKPPTYHAAPAAAVQPPVRQAQPPDPKDAKLH